MIVTERFIVKLLERNVVSGWRSLNGSLPKSLSDKRTPSINTFPSDPQLSNNSISLKLIFDMNVGVGRVILSVATWFKKQLKGQVDNPKPKAFVLPKFGIGFIPELIDPVVEIEILGSSVPDSKSSYKTTFRVGVGVGVGVGACVPVITRSSMYISLRLVISSTLSSMIVTERFIVKLLGRNVVSGWRSLRGSLPKSARLSVRRTPSISKNPCDPQLSNNSISLKLISETKVGAGRVILSVVTKLEKQLALQVDRPKPKAFVLPKFEILSIPGFELNVPVV